MFDLNSQIQMHTFLTVFSRSRSCVGSSLLRHTSAPCRTTPPARPPPHPVLGPPSGALRCQRRPPPPEATADETASTSSGPAMRWAYRPPPTATKARRAILLISSPHVKLRSRRRRKGHRSGCRAGAPLGRNAGRQSRARRRAGQSRMLRSSARPATCSRPPALHDARTSTEQVRSQGNRLTAVYTPTIQTIVMRTVSRLGTKEGRTCAMPGNKLILHDSSAPLVPPPLSILSHVLPLTPSHCLQGPDHLQPAAAG